MKNYQFLRLLLIAIPVAVFFWLLAQDLAISGKLVMTYDFSHDSPFVKRLWPPGRLRTISYDTKIDDAFQSMFADPVTFDVKLPRAFERATVDLLYKKDPEQTLSIGMRTDPKAWAWDIRPIMPVDSEGSWTVGRVQFNDLSAADFSNSRLHFLLNAPGLSEARREILLTEIRVIVEKEPLTFTRFFSRLW